MPEYLAPGVYVTEIVSGAKPIEGVSTSTSGLVGSDTVAVLQRLAQHPAPEWTQYNNHDPGVTLLELFAWLTESLVYRRDNFPSAALCTPRVWRQLRFHSRRTASNRKAAC